jgi:hypothetical protein
MPAVSVSVKSDMLEQIITFSESSALILIFGKGFTINGIDPLLLQLLLKEFVAMAVIF